MLGVKVVGGAKKELSACAMGKQGPPLAHAIFSFRTTKLILSKVKATACNLMNWSILPMVNIVMVCLKNTKS